MLSSSCSDGRCRCFICIINNPNGKKLDESARRLHQKLEREYREQARIRIRRSQVSASAAVAAADHERTNACTYADTSLAHVDDSDLSMVDNDRPRAIDIDHDIEHDAYDDSIDEANIESDSTATAACTAADHEAHQCGDDSDIDVAMDQQGDSEADDCDSQIDEDEAEEANCFSHSVAVDSTITSASASISASASTGAGAPAPAVGDRDNINVLRDKLKQQPLYRDCKATLSSFMAGVILLDLQSRYSVSNSFMKELFELLQSTFLPEGNSLPSYSQTRRLVQSGGVQVEAIHMCKNDCVAFRGPYVDHKQCPVCGSPRYKSARHSKQKVRVPVKVFRRLPLKAQLANMFEDTDVTKALLYAVKRKKERRLAQEAHEAEKAFEERESKVRSRDRSHDLELRRLEQEKLRTRKAAEDANVNVENEINLMCDVQDSPGWKAATSDEANQFHVDDDHPYNLLLSVSSDGFQPAGLNTVHSMSPIIANILNFAPETRFKFQMMLLLGVIPGPQTPKDMNPYLQPLVEELLELWQFGMWVKNPDAAAHGPGPGSGADSKIKIRVRMFLLTADNPAMSSMMKVVSATGHQACHFCRIEGESLFGSMRFLGHRRFLSEDHWMRRHADYGEREERSAPCKKTTQAVKHDLKLLDDMESQGAPHNHLRKLCYQLGKLGLSQFERLPYWEQSMRPPELMHILEVTSKRLIQTVKGKREIKKLKPKSKKARARSAAAAGKKNQDDKSNENESNEQEDPEAASENEPNEQEDENAASDLAASASDSESIANSESASDSAPQLPYRWTEIQLDNATAALRSIKVCPNFGDHAANMFKQTGTLKANDWHHAVQHLWKYAFQFMEDDKVRDVLYQYSDVMTALLSRVIKVKELAQLRVKVIEMLCDMERVLPKQNMTIAFHQMVHMVDYISNLGPAKSFWQYPAERYLGFLGRMIKATKHFEANLINNYTLFMISHHYRDEIDKLLPEHLNTAHKRSKFRIRDQGVAAYANHGSSLLGTGHLRYFSEYKQQKSTDANANGKAERKSDRDIDGDSESCEEIGREELKLSELLEFYQQQENGDESKEAEVRRDHDVDRSDFEVAIKNHPSVFYMEHHRAEINGIMYRSALRDQKLQSTASYIFSDVPNQQGETDRCYGQIQYFLQHWHNGQEHWLARVKWYKLQVGHGAHADPQLIHDPTKLHILDLSQAYKVSTPSHPKFVHLDGRVIHGQVMLAPVYESTMLKCSDENRESRVRAAKASQKLLAIIVHDMYDYER